MKSWKGFAIAGLVALVGCGEATVIDPGAAAGAPTGGKEDSGWVGADSYEVEALVRGTVRVPTASAWSDDPWEGIRTDETLQTRLVDLQIKFMKTRAEAEGWRFNQLADTVTVLDIRETEAGLELEYEAVTDMLGRLRGNRVPALEDLDTSFEAAVPLVPEGFDHPTMKACSKVDDSHSVADYNFHYYFAPDQADCDLELSQASLEIVRVFDRPVTYPEYDQLMQPLDDQGTVGFFAALVPNRGDNDPRSRFDAHAEMLEDDLGLVGTDMEDGRFRRYVWQQDGVAMIIDLYDPTELPWMSDFADSFRRRLGEYTLVHYNGHSSYGSKHLLDEPEAYSDAYQIITMHSCQSYAYYTRQVFRAKATEADPKGHALADVMATGKSSYPSGAPPTLRVLLDSLMSGMLAIHQGRPDTAPHWQTITKQMKASTWGDILYGVAGVRENRWQP